MEMGQDLKGLGIGSFLEWDAIGAAGDHVLGELDQEQAVIGALARSWHHKGMLQGRTMEVADCNALHHLVMSK